MGHAPPAKGWGPVCYFRELWASSRQTPEAGPSTRRSTDCALQLWCGHPKSHLDLSGISTASGLVHPQPRPGSQFMGLGRVPRGEDLFFSSGGWWGLNLAPLGCQSTALTTRPHSSPPPHTHTHTHTCTHTHNCTHSLSWIQTVWLCWLYSMATVKRPWRMNSARYIARNLNLLFIPLTCVSQGYSSTLYMGIAQGVSLFYHT